MDLFVVTAFVRDLVIRRMRTMKLLERVTDQEEGGGDKTPLELCIALILRLANNYNYWAFSSAGDIEKVWQLIRADSRGLDFVISSSIEFRSFYSTMGVINYTSNGEKGDSWMTLIKCLSVGLSSNRTKLGNSKNTPVADEDFLDRGMSSEQWEAAFQSNQWLVFVYLLSLSDIGVGTAMEALYGPPRKDGA